MFEIIENEDSRVYILPSDVIMSKLRFFEEDIDRFIRTDKRDLVLDMKNITALNSVFLSCLLRIKTGLIAEKRTVRLINYNEYVYRSLEVSGLERFFLFE
jgi:anti-anti-sigma regulatory factor